MNQVFAFTCVFGDDVACIVHHIGVVASATDQGVGTRCTVERVVCAVAGDDVGQTIACAVDFGATRQDQVFEVGAQGAGHRAHDQVFAFVDVFDDGVGHVVDDVGVVTRTTDQVVGAAPAVQSVVACQALQGVVIGIAGQAVVKLGATQVFDADEGVARGFGQVLR